jgi:hypothetical protein
LKTYIVYEPEDARAESAGERTEFVREKFSWVALFFTPLWLLWNRLWIAFVVFCAVEVLLASGIYLLRLQGPFTDALLLLPLLIVAFENAQLKRFRLLQKGYREADTVLAADLEGAERRYFERRKLAPTRKKSAPPASPSSPGISGLARSVIGLFPERGR